MMMNKLKERTASMLTLVTWCVAAAQVAMEQPNIIVIMADDLDYVDIGIYGGRQNYTPQLDQFAIYGLRFIDFHSNGPLM